VAVLAVNAVAAIALGCLVYAAHHLYVRSRSGPQLAQLQTE